MRPIVGFLELIQSYLDVEITLQPFWKGESQGKEYDSNRQGEVALNDAAAATHVAPLDQGEDGGPKGNQERARADRAYCADDDADQNRRSCDTNMKGCYRSHASTTLVTNMARVIGPTPPGIGAIHAATL